MAKKIGLGVLAALIILQFIRPSKNDSNENPHPMYAKYEVPEDIAYMLKVACNDCHSNLTKYPWYSNIQPIGWWLNSHVKGGKQHLNFSEFTHRRVAIQNHKFEEIIETVEEHEMPLGSYTFLGLHPEAKLSDAQRKQLTSWAQTQMDSLAARYPADSLVLRRRRAGS